MRLPRISPVHLALLGGTIACTLSASFARAQLAPPPPMQSGGLAPPPKESGPPQMAPVQPNGTQLALEAAQQEDSGRGLEFVYFNVEGGFEFVSLDAITKSGALVPAGTDTSAIGPLVGVASGVRLLYFTLGPRFRYAHTTAWDLWTLNLDVGWRVPLGKLEPHGELGVGYAKLGHSADGAVGADRGVSVGGFDFRLGGGFDYYATNVLSVGAVLDIELLRLARSSVTPLPGDPASVAAFGSSASSLGLTVTAAAVIGFHF
jgi:hypothetical protein